MVPDFASGVWHLDDIKETGFLLSITCITVNVKDLTSVSSRTFDKAAAPSLVPDFASGVWHLGDIKESGFLLFITCITANIKDLTSVSSGTFDKPAAPDFGISVELKKKISSCSLPVVNQ
ncbi:hypothetical protein AVEN_188064-1 [Araneus ventricosus]|uniref:Uncharacterized protein n=1 Tax=Araneus ventricosus TaxID=182803 RepID=A0A4Y2T6P4_ARAVE|nr:hypothetical protein AVEN_188064-1 [Araneus ventricosus]